MIFDSYFIEITHFIITAMLVGIIWVIQIIHYPSFKYIDKKKSNQFHRFHTRAITPIVAPLMIIELILTIHYAVQLGNIPNYINLILVGNIWLSTFLIQIPLHKKLTHNYDDDLLNQLIRTNWIRTNCWTIKLLAMFFIIIE